jgi:hypothetical protein
VGPVLPVRDRGHAAVRVTAVEALNEREQHIHDLAYELGAEHMKRRIETAADEVIGMTRPAPDPLELGPYDDDSAFARTMLLRSQLGALPAVEPLIDGVLSLHSAIVLFGPTGAGKTALAIGLACSVGTGTHWLGREVKPCPVLYVVGEGASGLDLRVAAWEAAWDTKVDDTEVRFYVKPESLAGRDVWAQIGDEARRARARFVVLDTFSSLAPDADETRDAPIFTRRLSDLAVAISGTALVVHHPGWGDADRTRGGYQLEANVDEVLKLAGGPQSDLVELTRKKVKEGPSGSRVWLRRRPVLLGYDERGRERSSVVMESASRDDEAERAVGDAEVVVREVFGTSGASRAQLRDVLVERLAASRASAYVHITRLEAAGVIRRAGGTDTRPWYEVMAP